MQRHIPRHRPISASPAFTLVEVLTVIGIVAVLVAILLGALANSRKRALETTCLSNIRQVGIALRMYRDDYDAWPEGWYLDAAPGQASREALASYLKNEQVKHCPLLPNVHYSYANQGGLLQNKVLFPRENYHQVEGLVTLLFCIEHSNKRTDVAGREGSIIGVRTDGSARRSPYKLVTLWYYNKNGWTQDLPANDAPIDDRVTFYALPGDQFPPE